MKLMIESTDKIVTLVLNGREIPARVWEGTSENEVKCHVFVTRLAVKEGYPEPVYEEFEKSLQEQRPGLGGDPGDPAAFDYLNTNQRKGRNMDTEQARNN